MGQRYYILEGLFILLGLALVVTAIKYPKDVFVKLPLEIIKFPFKLIWQFISFPLTVLSTPLIYLGEKYNWKITPTITRILDISTTNDDDKPYPATRNLKVDFKDGEKYFYVIASNKDSRKLIHDLLEALTEKHLIDDFKITYNVNQSIIHFPKRINFYDYHLLVQHLNNEIGNRNGFGIYKSDELQYYVFQDKKTLNNLVGFTFDKKYFSVYMLDDLEKRQYLRLNQKLKLETDWVEQMKV